MRRRYGRPAKEVVIELARIAVEIRKEKRVVRRDRVLNMYRSIGVVIHVDNVDVADGVFYKSDFIRAYYKVRPRHKIETLLRELRKLAEEGKIITYLDPNNKRSGKYILIQERIEEAETL